MSERKWIDVQKKTFTGWANNYLKDRILKIDDLAVDLEDGTLLINLLELLSKKRFPFKWSKNAKTRFQKIENCGQVIKFIQNEGIKLVAIGGEDIVDGQFKLILGLIWTLILRYQISNIEGDELGLSPKQSLMDWVNKQLEPYHVKINDFSESWKNGKALCALTDSMNAGVVDFNALPGNPVADVNVVMDIAQDHFEIPKIMDPTDFVEVADDLSIMTYVSYFRDYATNKEKRMMDEQEALELKRQKKPCAAQCTAEGPGLETAFTHHPAVFTITARNYYGTVLANGGHVFGVKIVGEDGSEAKADIKDNHNGTYTVTYVADNPVNYTIEVTTEDEQIKDSPFTVSAKPASSPADSYADGPGLLGAQANKPSKFKIHAKDYDGKPMTDGGDNFTVKIDGPADVTAEVVDNGDGTYDVTYVTPQPGDYTINIGVDGIPIKDTPVTVHSKPAPDASKCYAKGPGLESAEALQPTEFTIFAKDADGNPRTDGGDSFDVKIDGAPADVEVIDNDDGTYTVKYTPTQPGDLNITATVDGQTLNGFPVSVRAKAAPSAANSYAEGPGLERVFDNEPAEFTIHAVDVDGNPRTDGGDPFQVDIEGPSNVKPTITDNGDGTYTVKYEPTVAGPHKVKVTLRGEDIKDSPISVDILEGTDAGLTGVGRFSFTMEAMNKNGERKTFGGDKFEVTITGPAEDIIISAVDNNDGSYTGNYTLHGDGKFVMSVKINGKHVKGSPFKQNVGDSKKSKDHPRHTATAFAN